jgi:flagellar assembly protein FliH
MSSRILGRDGHGNVQPMRWRAVGSPSPAPYDTGAAGDENDPAADLAAQRVQEAQRRVAVLEARCRELEQTLAVREEGARRAGLQQGEQAANARLEPVFEKLARAITEIAGCRPRYRREAEQEVARLALAIARRVLRREVAVDPDALLGLVKAAIERIDLRETNSVRVHPQDAELVTALLHRIGSPSRIQVVGDAGLERGAAIFETTKGDLDASVETQLEEIERGFTDLFERR